MVGFTSNSRACPNAEYVANTTFKVVYVICSVQYINPLKALSIMILFQQSFTWTLGLNVNKTVYLLKN